MTTKQKKLTDAQKAALQRLTEGAAGFYDLIKVGAPGPTMAWLVKHWLAKDIGDKVLEITDTGRKALDLGRAVLTA